MQQSVLIICFSNLHNDPRVLRQVAALKNNYRIITAGYTATGFEQQFIRFDKPTPANAHWKYPTVIRKTISAFLKIKNRLLPLLGKRQYEMQYWNSHARQCLDKLKSCQAQLLIANDLNILPIAYRASKSLHAKLIFDAHEYYPLEFENNAEWLKGVQPLYNYLCQKYLHKANRVTVVSNSIGKKYQQEFGLKDFAVIDNAAEYYDLQPGAVNPKKIRLVYHGFAIAERKLENLVDVFNELDERFELHLILVNNHNTKKYYEDLRRRNENNKRIFFHDPVPFETIPLFLNQFDIGIYIWDEANFNYYATIPNKFYEFLQARLMIAISPSAELEIITKENTLGFCAKTYNNHELVNLINACSADDIAAFKANAGKCAKKLSSENNKAMILKTVNDLLKTNA